MDSLLGHVYCSVVVYMVSIYDSATDAIALDEKKPSSEGFDNRDDVWMYAVVYGIHFWLQLVSE